jgi:hypothetical protein
MTRLGRDDRGTWLFAPKGTAASYASYGPTPLAANFLTLIPVPEQWWVCTWMWGDPDTTIDIYVDIVLPPSWQASACLQVVDLDLDVIRHLDGHVSIEDEDDFAHHSTSLHYPHSVISSARRAANEVVRSIDGKVEPFNESPSRWLDVAKFSGVPRRAQR